MQPRGRKHARRRLSLFLSELSREDASESERSDYMRLQEAFKIILTQDEIEGTQALSIIGPYDEDDKPIWDFEEHPERLDDILEEAEGLVREIPGCRMGDMFDMGYCEGPTGADDGTIVSYGAYFFVQTYMLAILEGATQGRVSVQRLWKLSMIKGHYRAGTERVIPKVDYGPIHGCLEEVPWLFGDMDEEELPKMGSTGAPEEIAETLRKRGFWMWMRPDRFPLDVVTTLQPAGNIVGNDATESISYQGILKLPAEILQFIALELQIWEVVALASLNKVLYHHLLGNKEARDYLAKAFIHNYARRCLPSGESELKWWNERRGDDALGWDYLRRCWSESHSMRNRRRIWRAAESIEVECNIEEERFGI